MKLTKRAYGVTEEGIPVDLYTITNTKQMTVKITNYGCIVTTIIVPDKNGKSVDVVLGFDTLKEYLDGHPYFGAVVGRYANRIAKARFSINGHEVKLGANDGNNHLHGGFRGFDKVVWKAREIKREDEAGVQLSYLSKDGEEGYPGALSAVVIYTLNNSNELRIHYEAKTDKPTPVNLTHHSYFNLKGAGSGDVLNHRLTIFGDQFTSVNDELIPTGEIRSVKGTEMDFTQSRTIGERINDVKGGYDHNYVLNRWNGSLRVVASVFEPLSSRVLEVLTTEPGLQFYSGNFLDGTIVGKKGKRYKKHGGFCLETQHFPDSPNQEKFPSTLLIPEEVYTHTTIYRFSAK